MKIKLFNGLFGSDNHYLYSPNGTAKIFLGRFAHVTQRWLNHFAWVGMNGTKKMFWVKS